MNVIREWDMFECRFYIDFSLDRNELRFCEEMRRVGLTARPVINATSVFDDVLLRTLRCAGNMKKSSMSITLAHYRAIRYAFETGCKNVLIVESDVRFCRDVAKIADGLRRLPDDFDIALMDLLVPQSGLAASGIAEPVNGWARFGCLRSCACWALSRRGMVSWLGMIEKSAAGSEKLRVCDMYHGLMVRNGLVGYCAVPPLCVQSPHAGSNTSTERMAKKYADAGVDFSDYFIES